MATATTQQMTDALPASNASESTVSMVPEQTADVDHPDGQEVRRQVEFYFSDENLPTDLHLLQCCGGRDNDWVSLSRILSFKKMRRYKKGESKPLVVPALRKSTFLEISEDGKMIKRKIPLQGRCALDKDYFDDDAIAHDPRMRKPVLPLPKLQQTKPVYPDGITKNMLKPTGFERTYVEAPIMPEEHAAEQSMYDPDKLFVERIEIAIQRFRQKRRMHEQYALIFNKLMRFGGVDEAPRLFQGLSKDEMKEMDAEGIARARAIHSVPWDRCDKKKWIVDFAGVAKAFLSSWFPSHQGCSPEAIKNACQVPRSFYNYLRYHKVCPEFDEQLVKALEVCDVAEEELIKAKVAGLRLPGDFNKSASAIFGGAYAGLYAGDKPWAEGMKIDDIKVEDIGIRNEEAAIKFKTGVFIMGSDEDVERVELSSFKTLERASNGLEIVHIQLPTEETKALYAAQSKYFERKFSDLEPLGKLICKIWYTGDCDEWDLPKEKYPEGRPQRASAGRDYEFWVEESVLQECFVGLKLDADVFTLEGGIAILDDVRETMCSFFTWLPNELWMDRKPKEVRWLAKGRPGDEAEDENQVEGEALDAE